MVAMVARVAKVLVFRISDCISVFLTANVNIIL